MTQASGEPVDVHFELADSLYANAAVKDAKTVYLWLGVSSIFIF